MVFGEGNRFGATRSVGEGAADDAPGSYTYQRTGPYTGTLTIRSKIPGHQSCTAHLTFTSATAGAYTGSCADGSRRTGSFQMAPEDPFCHSLWDGLGCATAANLPHVYVGPAGANTASTEVVLSNTDPNPSACEVALLFHRGTSEAPPVRFNGLPAEGNLFHVTISREGAAIVTLTAPGVPELLRGAVYVYVRSPCTADSLEVQGRTLIEGSDGTIRGAALPRQPVSGRLAGRRGLPGADGCVRERTQPGLCRGLSPTGRRGHRPAPDSASGPSMPKAGSSAPLRRWPFPEHRRSSGPGSSASRGSLRCASRCRGPATSGLPSCRSGRSPAEAGCNTLRKASWMLSGWAR